MIHNALNYTLGTCAAKFSAGPSSVTGDGTAYLLALNATTVNESNCFSTGTYSYTVPTTGNYLVNVFVYMTGLTSSHTTGSLDIYIGGVSTYNIFTGNPAGMRGGSVLSFATPVLLTLTAGNVLTVYLTVSGGTKVVSLDATTSLNVLPLF